MRILTTQGPFPPGYRSILLHRIRRQVRKRLVNELGRDMLRPATRERAAAAFANPEILTRLGRATHLQVDEGQGTAQPCVAVIGLAEHEHDIFAPDGKHDFIPELRRACGKALETLGLDAGATSQQIKSRYKELVKRHHPDANGGDRGSEDRFRDVLHAYRVLKQAGLC